MKKSPIPKEPVPKWNQSSIQAPLMCDVLSLLASFLDTSGYTQSFTAILSEAQSKGTILQSSLLSNKTTTDLYEILATYHQKHKRWPWTNVTDRRGKDQTLARPTTKNTSLLNSEIDTATDTDSDSSSDTDDSDSGSSLSSLQQDDGVVLGAKRKRRASLISSEASSDTSGSESDSTSSSDSSSAESERPDLKRVKRDGRTSQDKTTSKGQKLPASTDRGDRSSSSDDTSSCSSSEDEALDTTSSSEDDESTSSDDESSSEGVTPIKASKVDKVHVDLRSDDSGSATSATLTTASPPPKSGKLKNVVRTPREHHGAESSGIHPDRMSRFPDHASVKESISIPTSSSKAGTLKSVGVPFSRIPIDTKVDPRFASNAYVSYDYADKAHQDLIVTRGKGFTKEKNKKKRGSYRGGTIDLTPKGIKFDD